MVEFDGIWQRAVTRKGEAELLERLPEVPDHAAIAETSDDRWLAAMAHWVFAAGFRWRVIQAKWPTFEEAFVGFSPGIVADFSEAMESALAQEAFVHWRQQTGRPFTHLSIIVACSTDR